MDGWARGEHEDGGVCKVGRKVGARKGKKGENEPSRWSRGKGEEERNGRGWGGRGAGEELLASVQETCSTRTRERHGDSFEGKKGGKGAR